MTRNKEIINEIKKKMESMTEEQKKEYLVKMGFDLNRHKTPSAGLVVKPKRSSRIKPNGLALDKIKNPSAFASAKKARRNLMLEKKDG